MSEKRSPRKFSDDFKNQMVALYDGGKSGSEICAEYDISKSLLYGWIKKAHSSGSFKAADNRTPHEEELLRLRKENKQLKMENDILKQAALIMGRK